jgi:peptide-methionine (S)-S-oxide reductase
MIFKNSAKAKLPSSDQALPGRETEMPITNQHAVLPSPLKPPYPENSEKIIVGMGCFWGAEKAFWSLPGVITTAVGYSAGFTPNPSYEEVCTGQTGHNEVVLVVFDTDQTNLSEILKVFWESHNPTQGMRQGNDQGTQYRSGIYFFNEAQEQLAKATRKQYQGSINQATDSESHVITTEIQAATAFYFAEDYHQQYLAKNPNGYCGLGGMGVCL